MRTSLDAVWPAPPWRTKRDNHIYNITRKEIHDRADEFSAFFSEEDLYAVVSPRIKACGENARTIKNTIQFAIEELMFRFSGCDS